MSEKGFTLIEMMIVVAIIAILAAIALPAYQAYISRSQAGAALADIAGGKTAFETDLLPQNISTTDPRMVGLDDETARCSLIELDSSATGFIRCTIRGNPRVDGKVIRLQRSADGSWECITDILEANYRPSTCRN